MLILHRLFGKFLYISVFSYHERVFTRKCIYSDRKQKYACI